MKEWTDNRGARPSIPICDGRWRGFATLTKDTSSCERPLHHAGSCGPLRSVYQELHDLLVWKNEHTKRTMTKTRAQALRNAVEDIRELIDEAASDAFNKCDTVLGDLDEYLK